MTKASIMSTSARPVITSVAVLLVLAILIGVAFPATVSAGYYMQQLQIAAFVGVLATGAMSVILLGEIDLSLPWTVTASALLSCGLYSSEALGGNDAIAIATALAFGMGVGAINGIGVALLRAPSMVWTLGVNAVILGLTVLLIGAYNPQTAASPIMRYLAVGRAMGGVPVAVMVWAVVGLALVAILRLTPLGSWIYTYGRSPCVAYLAGIPVRAVVFFSFVWAGLCSAVAGVLLAGYSGQAFQAMGDPLLLPSIAAVVVGGTKVTGGEGTYLGTVVGVLVLTLLANVLSLLQSPEAVRLIIYGTVIVVMLLVGGWSRRAPDA
jgi:ribose transport system permease protein